MFNNIIRYINVYEGKYMQYKWHVKGTQRRLQYIHYKIHLERLQSTKSFWCRQVIIYHRGR